MSTLDHLKKLAAVFLTIPLAVSLAACGSGGSDAPDKGDAEQSAESTPAESAEAESTEAESAHDNKNVKPGDILVITMDQAKEIFGRGSSPDNPDDWFIRDTDDNGVRWAAVMADQEAERAKVIELGKPFAGLVADGEIAVRLSEYTSDQVSTAMDVVGDISMEQTLSIAYRYTAQHDAIYIGGSKEDLAAFGSQAEGVDLYLQRGYLDDNWDFVTESEGE